MNRLICKSNSQIKVSHFAKLLLAVGATLCFLGRLHATGYYGPDFYLDDGGKNVDGSPEFYWAWKCDGSRRNFIRQRNASFQRRPSIRVTRKRRTTATSVMPPKT